MADTPTVPDILSAIQASGFLMDQEVASDLEALGFHVHTSRAFQDAEEGKSRELDVAAVRGFHEDDVQQLSGVTELLCECKNSEQPFVFLLRPRTQADDQQVVEELLLPRTEFMLPIEGRPDQHTRAQAIDHLGIRQMRHQASQKLKAVQFAKVVRDKSKWVANHAGLYDAIFYPLVKALIARREEVKSWRHRASYTWLFFPVVVTSGELYTLDTTDKNALPVVADYVSFTRHLKDKRLDGYFTVDFVRRVALADYIKSVVEPLESGTRAAMEKAPSSFRRQ